MISLNRFIKYYFLFIITTVLVFGFIVSFWGFHASLIEILFIELILIGVVCISVLLLWLTFKKIFPHLYDSQKKQPIALNQPENLSKEMNIEYELDVNDISSFYSYIYQDSPQRRHMRKIIKYISISGLCLTIFGAIIFIFVIKGSYLYAAEILVAIAALAFLWLIISPYFSKKVLKDGILNKYSQRQKILTGKHNFSINPNMIIDNSEMGDSKTYWGAVERIESTNQYLFLLTQGSGPYIVPRKAFSDDSSFKQFIDLVTLYHQTSIGKK